MVPAIIIGILSLATAGAGVAQQVIAVNASKGECEKNCKDTCKAKHKAFFDGRQECIKQCAADCVIQTNQPPPAPEKTGTNWWYVASIGFVIVLLLIIALRKK